MLKLTALHPNSEINNYYGYLLVNRNESPESISFGMKLLEKAVRMEPANGQIIDSQGWAFYRISKYDEAIQWLEYASTLTPHDEIIIDHLGDAYWQNKRFDEAKYKWQQSLELVALTDNEILKSNLQQKLKLSNGLQLPDLPVSDL